MKRFDWDESYTTFCEVHQLGLSVEIFHKMNPENKQVLSVTAICPQPGIVRNLATYFGRSFEPTAQQDKSSGTLRIPSPRVKSVCAKTQQDCLRTMTQLIQGKKFVI